MTPRSTTRQDGQRDFGQPTLELKGWKRAIRRETKDPDGEFQVFYGELLGRVVEVFNGTKKELAKEMGVAASTFFNARTQPGMINWDIVEALLGMVGAKKSEVEAALDLWAMDRMRLTRDGWVLLQTLIDAGTLPSKPSTVKAFRKVRDRFMAAYMAETKER